jgi:hypothetical protein
MFKRARNPHVTDFLHYIDHARQTNRPLFRRQRSHTRKEEPRIPHPEQQESRISARLPQSCPLDWFDPEYFNNMDVEFRALYINAPIALPLAEHCGPLTDMIANPPDWKNMSEAEFMETYGNAVQANYNLPTQEELDVLNGVENNLDQEDLLDPDLIHLHDGPIHLHGPDNIYYHNDNGEVPPQMPPPTELIPMTD